jgi:uncharacterized protein
MLISLVKLPAEGRRFEHAYAADELHLEAREFACAQPPRASGLVTRTGQEIRVKGRVSAELEVACDRCLDPVRVPVSQEFDLFYLPEDPLAGTSGETELHGRDLDFSVYQGDEVDLDELVLEQLELALPTRLLCREGCRGLCGQCGANLNERACGCEPPVDPRWQALADLKQRTE